MAYDFMQDNFATDGTMQTDASQLTLRNSDFFIPRFNTVKYGRHSIRYLGTIFMVQIDEKGQGPSHIIGIQNSIRKKDLSQLRTDVQIVTCVILETVLVNLLLD